MSEPTPPDALLPWRVLTPPTGGLQRLQQAVSTRAAAVSRRSLAGRFALAAAGTIACAFAIGAWVPGAWDRHRRSHALAEAVTAAVAAPSEQIAVARGAALAIPSGNDAVRIYLVQASPAPARQVSAGEPGPR